MFVKARDDLYALRVDLMTPSPKKVDLMAPVGSVMTPEI